MIIGISGKMHSGKDTLAAILQTKLKHHNYTFEMNSFANSLKQTGAAITNTPVEWWYTIEGKAKPLNGWGMTIGEFQQKLGSGIRDTIHKDAWIISLLSRYTPESSWIISDVRHVNEAETIKSGNGFLIRIDGDPAFLRKSSTRNLNDISETALDTYTGFDYRFTNVPPISLLQMHAENITKTLLKRLKQDII
jgi:hypothetical protein